MFVRLDTDGTASEAVDEPCPSAYVVDDEPGVRRYLQRLIGNSGLRIKSFSSASEFLDYPRHEGPGCLVLEMCLPGLDGLGLQQNLEDRAILFRSSSSQATEPFARVCRP